MYSKYYLLNNGKILFNEELTQEKISQDYKTAYSFETKRKNVLKPENIVLIRNTYHELLKTAKIEGLKVNN